MVWRDNHNYFQLDKQLAKRKIKMSSTCRSAKYSPITSTNYITEPIIRLLDYQTIRLLDD